MFKYSLIAIAAAAVLFTVGCEDSECCGVGSAPKAVITNGSASGQELSSSNTKANPLVVNSYTLNSAKSKDTDDVGSSSNGIKTHSWTIDGQPAIDGAEVPADGNAHEVCLTVVDDEGNSDKTCGWVKVGTETVSTKPVARFSLPTTCTPGDVINLNADSSSDSDGNVASYQWSKGATATTSATTVTCPDSGSLEVCLVVTDNDGQASSMVCKTANVAVGSCPIDLDIVVASSDDTTPTTFVKDKNYTVTTNFANCPDASCTWTVHSFVYQDNDKTKPVTVEFDCISGEYVPPNGTNEGSHVAFDDANRKLSFTPHICGVDYKVVEVNATCTRKEPDGTIVTKSTSERFNIGAN